MFNTHSWDYDIPDLTYYDEINHAYQDYFDEAIQPFTFLVVNSSNFSQSFGLKIKMPEKNDFDWFTEGF